MFNDWENKRTAHRLYWDLAANLLSIFGLFETGADLVRALPPRTPTLWINRRMKKSTSCFTGCLIVDAPDAQCSRWMLRMYDRVVVGSVVHTHEDRTYIKHQNDAAPLAPSGEEEAGWQRAASNQLHGMKKKKVWTVLRPNCLKSLISKFALHTWQGNLRLLGNKIDRRPELAINIGIRTR